MQCIILYVEHALQPAGSREYFNAKLQAKQIKSRLYLDVRKRLLLHTMSACIPGRNSGTVLLGLLEASLQKVLTKTYDTSMHLAKTNQYSCTHSSDTPSC